MLRDYGTNLSEYTPDMRNPSTFADELAECGHILPAFDRHTHCGGDAVDLVTALLGLPVETANAVPGWLDGEVLTDHIIRTLDAEMVERPDGSEILVIGHTHEDQSDFSGRMGRCLVEAVSAASSTARLGRDQRAISAIQSTYATGRAIFGMRLYGDHDPRAATSLVISNACCYQCTCDGDGARRKMQLRVAHGGRVDIDVDFEGAYMFALSAHIDDVSPYFGQLVELVTDCAADAVDTAVFIADTMKGCFEYWESCRNEWFDDNLEEDMAKRRRAQNL